MTEQEVELGFRFAPSYELAIGLDVITHPGNYGVEEGWARQVRRRMSLAARNDLRDIFAGADYLGWDLVDLAAQIADEGDGDTLIEKLRAMPAPELVLRTFPRHRRRHEDRLLTSIFEKRLGGAKLTSEEQAHMDRQLGAHDKAWRLRVLQALDQPEELKRKFVGLLEEFNQSYYAAVAGRIRVFLDEGLERGQKLARTMPRKELIAEMTGGLTISDDAEGVQRITLMPSFFITPFVHSYEQDGEVMLIYGVRPRDFDMNSLTASNRVMSASTIIALKALADETRLRILTLLAERPRYGRELARELSLTPATISHHMARLRTAGLTRTEVRMGAEDNDYYVIAYPAVEQLCREIGEQFRPLDNR
jgi:DNA-binding transcriptional ArsR family regulator